MHLKEETLNRLKERFPEGARVQLTAMDDMQAPPIGTLGTVQFVDAIGNIHVRWDNGSSLAVAYGEDHCERVD